MLPEVLHHLFSRRFTCKQWSVLISIAILFVGMLGRFDTVTILWISAPLLLLGLADAGYAAQAAQLLELLKASKGSGESPAFPEESAHLRRFGGALCSLSVWPFYLALWGIVVAAAFVLPGHSAALVTDAAVHNASQPGYPRPPVTPFPGQLRTPWPPFMRPGMTPNFGPKPLVRPVTPPSIHNFGTPGPVPGTPLPTPQTPPAHTIP